MSNEQRKITGKEFFELSKKVIKEMENREIINEPDYDALDAESRSFSIMVAERLNTFFHEKTQKDESSGTT